MSTRQNLLTFIIDEHPQTIALILSHLPPTHGAEIIAGLPSDRQLAVIRRVATMGQTNPEIIQEVERGLESRMSSVMSQQFEKAGGVPTVAEILNVTDRATERSLLENLAQEDPDLVEDGVERVLGSSPRAADGRAGVTRRSVRTHESRRAAIRRRERRGYPGGRPRD